MNYNKTKLEDIKPGDFVNLAAEDNDGHDFNFVDALVTKVTPSKDLFGGPSIDLFFGRRLEQYSLPCSYLFDVTVKELT